MTGREIDYKWDHIFKDFDVLNHIESNGSFLITSSQINRYKEARLMTKFDFPNTLPDIFRKNSLSILPTRRGEYIIGEFKAYGDLSESEAEFTDNRRVVTLPYWLNSVDYTNISSESTMLNIAIISGMINDLFEADELYETVTGRMGSGSFDFRINNTKSADKNHLISVKNSQLEIDSGIETENALILIEAKNTTTDSFLIRQLYYPYRLWRNNINKPIIPVYLQYKNGTYNFTVFEFEDMNDYNSLQVLRRQNYTVAGEMLTSQELEHIILNTELKREPVGLVPFPQANSLQVVMKIMTELFNSTTGILTKEEISLLHNDSNPRQSDYYGNAGKYLGYLKFENGEASLTEKGQNLMEMTSHSRHYHFVKEILSHQPFNETAREYLRRNGIPMTGPGVYDLIKDSGIFELYGLSGTTPLRRSSTINKWIKEIFAMVI